MKELKVKDIIKVTGGQLITGKEEEICEEFSRDTRTIEKGDIYLGIKGEKFDGNAFWKDALEKGAKGVIIQDIEINEEEKKKYSDRIIIKVKNSLEALYEIAKYKRSLYDIPVIAITGSVGKTSTKDIIASVLSQKYKTLKTEGNKNNNIGLPLTILKLRDHEAMVLEMGMNHFGEISLLTNIAKPTLAVMTNIGTSHIGNLGSRENILKAKMEILEGMKEAKIVVNIDNDLLKTWYEANKNNVKVHTYGIQNKSEINATKIKLREENSEFIAKTENEEIKIKVPVGGEHFVYNALCAVEVGKILNISNEAIERGIEKFELTKKRMDIKKLENGAILINSTYNASYEAVKASIEFLASYRGTRKIAVLGDMLELGEYSIELHQKVGKDIAQNDIDILMCTGNFAKYIEEKAKENKKVKTFLYNNKEEILQKLKEILQDGDVVLVKASHAMNFFEICQKL